MAKLLSLGTLGGAETFAGEATKTLRARHPEFSEPTYFPSMEDCWEALQADKIEVLLLGSERTGQSHHGRPVLENGWFVLDEVTQPLGCNLYVKPGTERKNIKRITGHGSTHQCVGWLEREFPGIPLDLHRLNSLAAGREALAGDCTTAVVGTKSLRNALPEMELIATDIDAGALSSWWAMSKTPAYAEQPRHLVISGRFDREGGLGRLVAAIAAIGFHLHTTAAFPVPEGASGVYDYLVAFSGAGKLTDVQRVVKAAPGTRLVGAFA